MRSNRVPTTPSSDPLCSTEHAAVHETIHTYLQGHAQSSSELMRQAFLPSAHIEGNREGVFTSWDLRKYGELFNGTPATDEATRLRSIDWVDVAGDAAAAKATLIHGSVTFTDYFVLVKVSGRWQISNKVYSAAR